MANPTTNFGWVMPTATDLVTSLPADFDVFGQGVDTSLVDLLGGTTGQVLSKTSATSMAFTWIANDQGDITGVTAGTGITVTNSTGPVPTVAINTAVTADLTTAQTLTNKTLTSPALTTPTISTFTTNGDTIYGTGSGVLARRAIGTTGQVLTVAGGIPTWATPSGGYTLISATATTSTTAITIGSIPQTYTNIQIMIDGVTFASTAALRFKLYNNNNSVGSGVMAATAFGSTSFVDPCGATLSGANSFFGSFTVTNYAQNAFGYFGGAKVGSQGAVFGGGDTGAGALGFTSIVVTSVAGTANFSAGTVRIYGI